MALSLETWLHDTALHIHPVMQKFNKQLLMPHILSMWANFLVCWIFTWNAHQVCITGFPWHAYIHAHVHEHSHLLEYDVCSQQAIPSPTSSPPGIIWLFHAPNTSKHSEAFRDIKSKSTCLGAVKRQSYFVKYCNWDKCEAWVFISWLAGSQRGRKMRGGEET